MTAAKKKANELVDRYIEYVEAYSSEGQLENAKTCAIIAVNEVLDNLEDHTGEDIKYWQEVKSEIKAIKS
jgi:LPS O-antigen subunit length determinant protein (WzzB/FepE family)